MKELEPGLDTVVASRQKMDINSVLKSHEAWLNRGSEPGKQADLKNVNLRCTDLEGADLREANLEGANLEGANLRAANLRGADLRGANLQGVNLWGCNGNLVQIKSILCTQYPVTYTVDMLQIGCKRHPIVDWWGFDDKYILEMGGKAALKWWRTWKPILKQIIETEPAEAD
jgi:hypothetical protein